MLHYKIGYVMGSNFRKNGYVVCAWLHNYYRFVYQCSIIFCHIFKFPPLIWVLYQNVTKYDASQIKGVNFENVTKYDATLLQKSALINAKTSQIWGNLHQFWWQKFVISHGGAGPGGPAARRKLTPSVSRTVGSAKRRPNNFYYTEFKTFYVIKSCCSRKNPVEAESK